jgi:hypothetical protein
VARVDLDLDVDVVEGVRWLILVKIERVLRVVWVWKVKGKALWFYETVAAFTPVSREHSVFTVGGGPAIAKKSIVMLCVGIWGAGSHGTHLGGLSIHHIEKNDLLPEGPIGVEQQ